MKSLFFAVSVATLLVATPMSFAGSNKVCKKDFKTHCEGMKFKKKSIMSCLGTKTDQLSAKCKTFVEKNGASPAGPAGPESESENPKDMAKNKVEAKKSEMKNKVQEKKDAMKQKADDALKGWGF